MYQIINTETGEPVIDRVYATVNEASIAMKCYYPISRPWDGVAVPVAVHEVK